MNIMNIILEAVNIPKYFPQIPVFFCNIFETYQACHGCNQSAETSNIGSDN